MREYLKEAIENISQYIYKPSDRIYLMGRISHLQFIKDILEEKKYRVYGILDNDTKKQGLIVDDMPILSADMELKVFDPNRIIFIYSPKYSQDMVRQCEENGYEEGKNVFVIDKPDIERNVRLVNTGIKKYEDLKNKFGTDVKLFYADCPRGDFFLISLYFRKYCIINKISNYVVVSHSKGLSELAEIFNMKPFESISLYEGRGLSAAWKFLGENEIDLVPLTIWQGDFRFNSCLMRQDERFSFMDTFRCMIFGFGSKESPQFNDYSDRWFDVDNYARVNKLEKGKAVLLCPFSYSLQSFPEEFWKKLSDLLKSKGYVIAVNTGNPEEHNFFDDSVTVQLDFSKIVHLMEYLGIVIGMRSGFFDITCMANCKRIVLYPKGSDKKDVWNSTDIGFCSMKNMGLREDAVEIEVIDYENAIKEIDRLL